MEPKSIDALVEQAIKLQLEFGLAMQSVYGGQYASLASISRFFHEHGDGNYSHTTMEQYRQMLKDRLDSSEIGRTHYISMIKAIERVTEVYNTGRLKWSCRTRLSKFALNEEYEAALNGFLKSRQLRCNTLGDYIWVIRKYLAYLQQDGCTQLSHMTTEKLAEYIIYCTHSLKRSTLHDIMCYTRAFHKYLEDNGQVKISYMSILSIPVVRGTKIQQPLTSAELDAILHCVDRSTDKGTRNYIDFKMMISKKQ